MNAATRWIVECIEDELTYDVCGPYDEGTAHEVADYFAHNLLEAEKGRKRFRIGELNGFLPSDRKPASMEQEGGITEVSLKNAAELMRTRGLPVLLEFWADTKKGDYFVTAWWDRNHKWCFSGFSWGYGGTGPHGLNQFLRSIGIEEINADTIPIHRNGTSCAYYGKDLHNNCEQEKEAEYILNHGGSKEVSKHCRCNQCEEKNKRLAEEGGAK